jgi:DNA-directed RNA polymerase specialized sigma24 family protein
MLAALYETHFERVARYIAVRIGNFSEAEDLASEVSVRAFRGVGSYTKRASLFFIPEINNLGDDSPAATQTNE